MQGIHQGPGDGESLFGGRIVLKSGLEQLTVTESWFATARPGADLHYHREHADSFYSWQGFMEGACLSGIRSANELLADIKSGAL